VKGPWFTIVSWCVLGIWLLAGCAGNQMRSDVFASGNQPQVLIPGATRSEVKGLAMGSARAKGWNIVTSTDDRLVMQRPLDPASPSALALGVAKSAVPPVIEVTSAFAEQSGGVNVALAATLISQPPGEPSPKRVDYTENYRDALEQSLASLRSNWTSNRQRVANSMPTQSPNTGPPATGTDAGNNTPLVQAWGQTVADGTAPKQAADPVPAPTPSRAPTQPRESTFPTATPPAPGLDQAATTLTAPSPSQPTPAPRPSTPSPAPVVDGSNSVPDPRPAERTMPSQPTPEPVEPKDNMLSLNQTDGTGVWAYYAEQYARLRGCNVTDAGAQLINSGADGEILKVSCVGSDSYLLKCQNGACRGLGTSEREPKTPGPKVREEGARLEQRPTQTQQAKTVKPAARSETTAARGAAKPEVASVKVDAKAAKPETKTAKVDAKAVKPEAKTAKVDAKAAKPEAKTAKADAKAAKPVAKTAKVDAKAAKPEAKTAKADAKAAKPEAKTAKADAKAAKPEAKTAKVDAKAAKPVTKIAKVDAKAAKPGAKTAKAE
jgi:chemotaxis protein histidine kinase CheA